MPLLYPGCEHSIDVWSLLRCANKSTHATLLSLNVVCKLFNLIAYTTLHSTNAMQRAHTSCTFYIISIEFNEYMHYITPNQSSP